MALFVTYDLFRFPGENQGYSVESTASKTLALAAFKFL
jgi:hypothetical protein